MIDWLSGQVVGAISILVLGTTLAAALAVELRPLGSSLRRGLSIGAWMGTMALAALIIARFAEAGPS